MRVVAGTAKGRTLVAPDGSHTRPTSDRVRESIFNALYSLDDVVDGARVVDLYAGSGALGIEALSRGAESATFVDSDRSALDAVRRNLVVAGFESSAVVTRSHVHDWLRRAPGEYDLVLCDPPYAFTEWSALMAGFARVAPRGMAVLESDREIDPGDGWAVIRSRRYGGTVVTIVHRRSAA